MKKCFLSTNSNISILECFLEDRVTLKRNKWIIQAVKISLLSLANWLSPVSGIDPVNTDWWPDQFKSLLDMQYLQVGWLTHLLELPNSPFQRLLKEVEEKWKILRTHTLHSRWWEGDVKRFQAHCLKCACAKYSRKAAYLNISPCIISSLSLSLSLSAGVSFLDKSELKLVRNKVLVKV